MTVAQKAVEWATDVASSPIHGYDQNLRWGPDYDCSSFIITAYEKAGVPVKSAGATYTGNMRTVFENCGFKEVDKSNLKPGDVLLNERNHVAMYIGNGKVVQARLNELGKTTGGKTGDQTGGEICVSNYYDYPWDCVLRYEGNQPIGNNLIEVGTSRPSVSVSVSLPMLSEGKMGNAVKSLQTLLINRWKIGCGSSGVDGDFGPNTKSAVAQFQQKMSIETDGVVGQATWTKLIN